MICLVAALAACTHNNGDIGLWFGTWQVEEITVDGVTNEDYDGQSLMFSFQSDVFQMRLIEEMHESNVVFGNWSDNGNATITVTFPEDIFQPQPISRMEKSNLLTVEKITSKNATLRMTTSSGSTVLYRLKHIF